MKAVLYQNYGPPEVLKFQDVEKPLPANNQVLVKIKASSVTAGVLFVRSGKHPDIPLFTFMMRLMFGIFKPRKPILGYEFSGVVEATGKSVTNFKTGDYVFGTTTGLKQGSYAEYICVPESSSSCVIATMPQNLSFEEAAALPVGGMTAVDILNKAELKKGQNVLIYGASGSVGTYSVQLAKYYGTLVTGVCSTENISLIRSIGADEVVDYTKKDISTLSNKYDIVFDAVGKISKSSAKKILKKDGKFITVKSVTKEKTEYLIFLKKLSEAGNIKPVIDRIYSIEEIADAHSYAEKGHKKGNVIIKIS